MGSSSIPLTQADIPKLILAKSDLIRFESNLRMLGLFDLLSLYGTEKLREAAILFDIPLLPRPLGCVVLFFILGRPVRAEELTGAVGYETLTLLRSFSLIDEADGNISLRGLRLISHFGVPIFCQPTTSSVSAYYDNDSLALGRLVFPVKGTVLDLCAGVGTQSILAAKTAERVVAVEAQEELAGLFKLNALMNAVDEKIEFMAGDYVDAGLVEKFDLVISNPPLLPVPDGMPFPFVGNGGADGIVFLKRALERLPRVLKPKGQTKIIGTILGNSGGPFVEDLIRVSHSSKLSCTLMLISCHPLSNGSQMFEALLSTINICSGKIDSRFRKGLSDHFRSTGATHLFSFVLHCVFQDSPINDLPICTTHHYLRNQEFWTV